MRTFGFDFQHGRLDVSHHPFCGGVPQDVRITTRYSADNFIESLLGVIHETGHACYEQGLPRQWGNQPVGSARGMHLHESQSLLFEIFVGRSRSFLHHMHPMMIRNLAHDPQHPFWSFENVYRLMNRVERSYIRVNADEVTYPAHIVLRYEIERDLIAGHIEVEDVPELWDQKMKAYLGLSTRGNDKDGCMQDVHWPSGAFGYFPSYSLGAMTAAQIFSAAKREMPGLLKDIEGGRLESLFEWLRNKIWSRGCFYSTNDLLIHATGETLQPRYFREQIESKYLS
jgi:carboxypeptidase Taq